MFLLLLINQSIIKVSGCSESIEVKDGLVHLFLKIEFVSMAWEVVLAASRPSWT
jgi:hypothetical protein